MSGLFADRAAATQTAEHCGANQDEKATRFFADSDAHGWHEYRDIKSIPEVQLNVGSTARLWPGSNGNSLLNIEEPGEDFNVYTDYCFDKTGHLLYLRYVLRTAWGWGFREEGPFSNGKLEPEIAEFFATETGKPVKKPEQADEIPDAQSPHLYLTKSQLPFYKLLSK
jgi:hypothetical protein